MGAINNPKTRSYSKSQLLGLITSNQPKVKHSRNCSTYKRHDGQRQRNRSSTNSSTCPPPSSRPGSKKSNPPVQGGVKTIGHDSGRRIVEILKKNPQKDPESYDEDDIDHMRRVVAYCKRHLAQEEKAKQNTDSKSYKSLKNWGHDALKN